MDLRIARAHYRDWLRTAGRSENSVRSAMQALNLVGPNAELAELGPARLELALDGELAPASYNRYRQVWVSFFDWCVQRGYASGNPAKQLPTRKVIEQPNLILTPDQMLGMLDNANPVERIALALGMNTALRAGDVSALRVGDVDLNSLTLRTKIQKTGGYDEKPITAQLRDELMRWFDAYSLMLNVPLDGGLLESIYLVPSYTHNSFGGSDYLHHDRPLTHLHRLVQRALERQGLPTPGEGFHTLRRSAARALFEKLRNPSMGWSIKDPLSSAPRDHWCEAHQVHEQGGHDIVLDRGANYDHALLVVKEFLNHKSVEQTQRYLGINHERQIRDDLLRGKDFLVKSPADPWEPTACTAGVVDGINQRHGLAYDNPERIY